MVSLIVSDETRNGRIGQCVCLSRGPSSFFRMVLFSIHGKCEGSRDDGMLKRPESRRSETRQGATKTSRPLRSDMSHNACG